MIKRGERSEALRREKKIKQKLKESDGELREGEEH